nr:endochitinase A1-like isoform X1 [Rhipicephalus microplus]
MDSTIRNVLALSALISLPLLEAYCPRLAPDAISGKVIPCRYLCVRISFFELPSIILSTERDGVLCSTLLLRRRGVCKNGGCYPFEPEGQKRKGIFRRVITNIDKFASGSYKKAIDKPGTQSGPIVSVNPSLRGISSKDTVNGTSPPASSQPPSSSVLPSISNGTSSLVRSVGSALTSIWVQAFPFNLKAGPPRRPTAANKTPSSTHQQEPGESTATSSGGTSIADVGGAAPVVPPSPTEGSSNHSPLTNNLLGSKLFSRISRLSPTLTFTNKLLKLPGKGSAPAVVTGTPISPVVEIDAINATTIKKEVPGASGSTTGTISVKTGESLPTAVPPALGNTSQISTPAVPPGLGSRRVIPGLLPAIVLGRRLGTPLGGNKRAGILGSHMPTTSATDVQNSLNTSDGMTGIVGGMSPPNANSVGGPPVSAPAAPDKSSNRNIPSGTLPALQSLRLISKLRSTAALRSALSKLKHKSSESSGAPLVSSSRASQKVTVTNAIPGASSVATPVNSPDVDRGMPALPALTAEGNNKDVPALGTPQRLSSPGTSLGLTSTRAPGKIPSTSHGKNPGSSMVVKSTNNSATEIDAGSGASNNELSIKAGSTPSTFTNYATSSSNATPLTTPARSGNKNTISGAPRLTLLTGTTSEHSTVLAVNKSPSELPDAKTQLGISPANPSLAVSGTGVENPSVATISTKVQGDASLVPGVEIPGSPATPPHSAKPRQREYRTHSRCLR